MSGREMFRQTKAKPTNAQTQVRQPNKQMVESPGTTLAAQAAKSSLSSNSNNAKDKVD